jgi:hypothetical protein
MQSYFAVGGMNTPTMITTMTMLTMLTMLLFSGRNAHIDLKNLERDFFMWRLEDRPEFASDVGIYRFNDRLEHFSLRMFDDRLVR